MKLHHPQGQEFYPLGKPNKRPLAAGTAAHKKKAEKKPSSFFDFLIPSFVRGASSKADREGPVGKVKKYPAVPGKKRRPGKLSLSFVIVCHYRKCTILNRLAFSLGCVIPRAGYKRCAHAT